MMKKILCAAAAALLLVSLSAAAFAATGVGTVTTVSVTPATAEKAGSVDTYTYICALTLDAEGKIVGVDFDALQTKGTFDTTGAAGEFNAAPLSKNEIKDGYGMKAISPIGLEWYEQMNALEAWCIGKTVDEVLAMNLDESGHPTDADLVSGCTVHINDQLVSLKKAAEACAQ